MKKEFYFVVLQLEDKVSRCFDSLYAIKAKNAASAYDVLLNRLDKELNGEGDEADGGSVHFDPLEVYVIEEAVPTRIKVVKK